MPQSWRVMLSRIAFKWHPVLDLATPVALAALAAALMLGERARPLRQRTQERRARYPTNLAVGAVSALVERAAVLPAMRWSARVDHRERGWAAARAPRWWRGLIAILLLDYTMYLWHRANHAIPLLWRFHRAHHSDRDLDVSTAWRFHFLEIAASVPFRVVQTWAVAASPRTAWLYEGLMQSATLFHHTNLRLPRMVERVLEALVVTPRLHGIHHSAKHHAHANWSVVFSLWDRLHGSRCADVDQGELTIGVAGDQVGTVTALQLLLAPFRAPRLTAQGAR